MITPWCPNEVLGLAAPEPYTCFGTRKDRVRCRNPIGLATRKIAEYILKRMSRCDRLTVHDDIKDLVEVTLCGRVHRKMPSERQALSEAFGERIFNSLLAETMGSAARLSQRISIAPTRISPVTPSKLPQPAAPERKPEPTQIPPVKIPVSTVAPEATPGVPPVPEPTAESSSVVSDPQLSTAAEASLTAAATPAPFVQKSAPAQGTSPPAPYESPSAQDVSPPAQEILPLAKDISPFAHNAGPSLNPQTRCICCAFIFLASAQDLSTFVWIVVLLLYFVAMGPIRFAEEDE